LIAVSYKYISAFSEVFSELFGEMFSAGDAKQTPILPDVLVEECLLKVQEQIDALEGSNSIQNIERRGNGSDRQR
jgi:hypothetical protein